MSDPFIAEIKMVSFNFPPRGWAFCNGQLLPINQNQALFSILGTTYGGNGQTNFALPNLQGRVPIHEGSGFTLGQTGGESAHTLTLGELPAHAHAAASSPNVASTGDPTGAHWAKTGGGSFAPTPDSAMATAAIGGTGGSQPHENLSPYLTLNFVIALVGIFPSRN